MIGSLARTRDLERRRRGLALPLALWLVLQLPASAADITVDGSCTLVDAITAANTDMATGNCPAGSGADKVILTSDVSLTAINNYDLGAGGLPVVTTPITVEGGGYEISRPEVGSTPAFRIFGVDSGGSLALKNTTLNNGGGPNFIYDFGGGVYVGPGGTVELVDSTVTLCDAYYGGAIATSAGTVTLTGSTLAFNGAFAGGGAINSEGGTITLVNSTVSGNTDDFLYSSAIAAYSSTVTITNSTFSGNTGAITGAASVTGSIIANSTGPNCPDTIISDGGGNLATDSSCGTIPSGLTFFDPVLRDNGGPTMTHLINGSPGAVSNAINFAGVCGLATDQRGYARDDGLCDSGSYEYGAGPCTLLELKEDTITGAETHQCQEIHLGPNLAIMGPSGHLTATAELQVVFLDGVSVLTDGKLTAGNAPPP